MRFDLSLGKKRFVASRTQEIEVAVVVAAGAVMAFAAAAVVGASAAAIDAVTLRRSQMVLRHHVLYCIQFERMRYAGNEVAYKDHKDAH